MPDTQTPAVPTPEGVVSVASPFGAAETLERLRRAITARGLTLFAVIDHSGEAARAGLQMRETKVVIFGSPRAGTPLMLASPLLALDLPLRALVWEDAAGQVWISFTDPAWLARRYALPAELAPAIAGIGPLIASALQS
jgi:uncharacterized protein (DUF302 family)